MGNYSEAEQNNYRQTSRSALRLFGSVSLGVYATALTYCILTHNYLATGIVAVAFVLITGLIVWMYKTM